MQVIMNGLELEADKKAVFAAEHPDASCKFYVGKLCEHNHVTILEDGTVLDKSLRYYCNKACVRCQKIHSKNYTRAIRYPTDPQQAEARRNVEMLSEARELGMTLEEYKAALK